MSDRAIPMPDPMHAHGAWVFLFASIGGGALVGSRAGVEVALLIGTGFVGGFLVAAGLVHATPSRAKRLALGALLAAGTPPLALLLEADRAFLTAGPLAAALGLASVVVARTRGFLSPPALTLGVTALALSSAAAGLAGGASLGQAASLCVLLATFFSWRSLRIARPLRTSEEAWPTRELRAKGLREAGLAAGWTLLAVAVVA